MDAPAEPSPAPAPRNPVARLLTALFGPLTRRNLVSWLLLVALVLLIRWLLFESFTIPSGSMEPTLHGDPRWLRGDRVGVNKWIYGPRVPFMNKRIFHFQEPQRWDIVVFRSVDPDAEHPTLVKRIVALPGEHVRIKDGRIWIKKPGEAEYSPQDPPAPDIKYTTVLGNAARELPQFALQMAVRDWRDPLLTPSNEGVQGLYRELAEMKTKLNGANPDTVDLKTAQKLFQEMTPLSRNIVTRLHEFKVAQKYPLRYGILPDEEYSRVPDNCYLVCGDNSPDSADGRIFGWLPNDNIAGRVFCTYWPLNRLRDFSGFSRTWWGMALLYGVPALLAGWEIAAVIRRRRR